MKNKQRAESIEHRAIQTTGGQDYAEEFGQQMLALVQERRQSLKLQAAAVADTSDSDTQGWRRLTATPGRELPGMSYERMIEIAYWLWKTNPLAGWIIEITTAFICGDGFSIEAKNDELKALLEGFWRHPMNKLDFYVEQHTREVAIYGNLVLPKFITPYGGKVALGYVDPANIAKVVTDPENVKIVIGIKTSGANTRDGRKYKTVLDPEAEEFLSPDARSWRQTCQYECFYFRVNCLSNELHGTSDLFRTADWLDQYEQYLFDSGEKFALFNTFIWDLMVEDGTTATISEELKNVVKKSGAVYGHNQKVTLEAKNPDLKAMDASAAAQLFRNHILGSHGLPSFWYGGAQDSNLAVSQEMSAPTYRMLTSRQRLVKSFWTEVLADVVREADAHGMLKGIPAEERGFTLNVSELAVKDITKFSAAIQQLTTSLVGAEANDWIDRDTAVSIFAFSLALIGYEIDVDAVKQKLENDGETKGYEDYLEEAKSKEQRAKDQGQPPEDQKTAQEATNA